MKQILAILVFFVAINTSAQVPPFSHIVIVIGENTSASSVFGNSNAPYINSLATNGAKFINSYGITHPSQPNYLDLYSGDNQGVTDDSKPSRKFTTANLGYELILKSKTFITYSEGLPSVGSDIDVSGNYARKHNPAANWIGSGTNQIPSNTNQPFTAFPANYNNLPTVCFVIPDQCSDGHNSCAPLNNKTKQFDSWVQTNLDAYKQWCINNNSLLIVTYDEDDFSGTNKIATVFYGANVAVGSYSQTINHYNVLRTIEDANSLEHAGTSASSPITFVWTSTLALDTTRFIKPSFAVDNFIFQQSNLAITVSSSKNQPVNYEVFNISGSKIEMRELKLIRGKNDIRMPVNLQSGLYIIRLSNNYNSIVKKIKISQ